MKVSDKSVFSFAGNSPIYIFKVAQIVLEKHTRRPFMFSTQMRPLGKL